jgi:hypothetical protein
MPTYHPPKDCFPNYSDKFLYVVSFIILLLQLMFLEAHIYPYIVVGISRRR